LLARVIDDDRVFDHRAIARGGDPDGARADAVIGRQGESEEPAVAVLADQIGRHRVGGDPGDEPRLAERCEATQAQGPLAVQERQVLQTSPGDQEFER
jgi:hypothetical protein